MQLKSDSDVFKAQYNPERSNSRYIKLIVIRLLLSIQHLLLCDDVYHNPLPSAYNYRCLQGHEMTPGSTPQYIKCTIHKKGMKYS